MRKLKFKKIKKTKIKKRKDKNKKIKELKIKKLQKAMALLRPILCEKKLMFYYVKGVTQEIMTIPHQWGDNGMMTKILRKNLRN